MAIYAQIIYENLNTSYPDQFGGSLVVADVYISLFDSVSNLPVSGNGVVCNYITTENGVNTPYSALITGTRYLIGYNIVLTEFHYASNGDLLYGHNTSYYITGLVDPQPTVCDIQVTVTSTNETANGANDGTITAFAVSSFTGIQYSIDGIHYQSSGTFNNLHPGAYTVYAKDSHPCVATTDVTIIAYINPIYQNNFVSALPVVQVSTNNLSRWSAGYNPIYLKYQRRDVLVTSVAASGQDAVVTLNRTLGVDEVNNAINDTIYLSTAIYDYYGPVTSHQVVGGFSVLTISGIFTVADTTGFINIPLSKQGYKIVTEITSGNNKITCTHSPNKKGYTNGDISGYLKTLVSAVETNDFTSVNFLDKNLSQSYTLRYREVWDTGESSWFNTPYDMFVTFSAKQMGDVYGGNMGKYVTFPATDKAKWLTAFEVPVLNIGLPFDLSFIYSENLTGLKLFAEIMPNVVGATGQYLLNSTGGYLLTNAGDKIQIISNVLPPIKLTASVGINRLNIPQNFDPLATSAIINIYYLLNNDVKVYIMQPITIKIVRPCSEPYEYLKWINNLGGVDYFRFGYNQIVSADIANVQVIKRFVDDWSSSDTQEDIIQKTSVEKVSVGSDQLTSAEVKAMQSLRRSIKVQRMTSANPVGWKTVILEDGTINSYETRRSSGAVSFSFSLPSANIQLQ